MENILKSQKDTKHRPPPPTTTTAAAVYNNQQIRTKPEKKIIQFIDEMGIHKMKTFIQTFSEK